MLRRDYFAHGAFAARLKRFGARGPTIGENLGKGVEASGSLRGYAGARVVTADFAGT
jgi:hypothetical protein